MGFLIIAACTFALSYDAIRDVAITTGAVDPNLAWIVPLAVDGMIITATAVLWTESLANRGWHIFPLFSIIGPALLSMWANVSHSSGETLLADTLAAVPPAGLILSLELVAWQIRRERGKRHNPGQGDQDQGANVARVHVASNGAPAMNGHVERSAIESGTRNHNWDDIWPDIMTEVQSSTEVPSQRALARRLGVSRGKVTRTINMNRDEWERITAGLESVSGDHQGE
jgi:hypothetical protein